MLNIKGLFQGYETCARALPELLPWMAMPTETLVLNKDGSLLACYEFAGVDAEGVDSYEVDRIVNLVERSLAFFDERISIWSTVDRRRIDVYPEGNFDNEMSRTIDNMWRNHTQERKQYCNRYFVSFLYSEPTGALSFFERVSVELENGTAMLPALFSSIKTLLTKSGAYYYEQNLMERSIGAFSEILSSFEELITELNVRRLAGANLLTYLHHRCSPCNEGQPVNVPRIPAYLDSYLCDNTLHREGSRLRFVQGGSRYVSAISVKDWPDLTHPGLLDVLLSVPGEITISQCFRMEDKVKAKKYITDIERHNRNMEKSMMSYFKESVTGEASRLRDQGRVHLADDANDALTEATAFNRAFGWYNLTVCSYGDTPEEMEMTTHAASQVLQQNGFITVREGMHLLSAWCGTLPGQWAELVRWFFVSGGNLADLFPARSFGIGDVTNPFLSVATGKKQPALTVFHTEFHTPYYFSFHQSDLAHTLLIGPSRSGKSLFLNFMVSQFRKHRPCNVFIFDKDYSCRIPTLLQGGQHVDLAGEFGAKVKLNPMQLIGEKDTWPWLASWLEILLTSRGYELTADDIEAVWKSFSFLEMQPKSEWRLQSLVPNLPARLGEQLHEWVGDGANANIFDNEEDSFALGDFTCVEMKNLLQNPTAAAAFLEYAFFRINRSLDGRPTLIEIEEAWFMLSEKRFTPRLNDWLRTLAKRNAFLVMATQSLDEISRSDIFATIIDNIPNRIYLANANALAHEELYRSRFMLNRTQIDRIRTATPKLNYYIVTPQLTRMVEVYFPLEMVACLTSVSAAQTIFTRCYRDQLPGWQQDYLMKFIEHQETALR